MPQEYTKTPKDRVIRSIKRRSHSDMSEFLESAIELIGGRLLYQFRNNAQYRPLYWNIWSGFIALPVIAVTNMEMFLAAVAQNALPDVASLRQRAFWKAAQWVNSAAAAVGPIDTTQHGQQEWNDPTKGPMVSMLDPTLSRSSYGFGLLARSGQSQTYGFTFELIFEELLVQREWGNDNAFRDREDDGLTDEDEMGEY